MFAEDCCEGGEINGASASFEVRSKARGGDLGAFWARDDGVWEVSIANRVREQQQRSMLQSRGVPPPGSRRQRKRAREGQRTRRKTGVKQPIVMSPKGEQGLSL